MTETPPTPKTNNKGFAAAWLKGWNAALNGDVRESCPYPDHRTPRHGHVTFSRAFRRYWFDGYDTCKGRTP